MISIIFHILKLDMGRKQVQCKTDSERCKAENERLNSKIHTLEAEQVK